MLQTMKTRRCHDPLPASETLYAVYRSPVYARDYQNRPWSHPLSVSFTFITVFYRNILQFKCQALHRISSVLAASFTAKTVSVSSFSQGKVIVSMSVVGFVLESKSPTINEGFTSILH